MKNSIVAGSVARKFLHTLPPEFRTHCGPVDCGKFSYHLTVSMSSRPQSQACKIYVCIYPLPNYDANSRNWMMSKRLRKSDPETLYRHLADLCETLRQKRMDLMVALRERVCALSETRQYDVDALPRESSTFDEMSEEECRFWLDWLAKQPKRAA